MSVQVRRRREAAAFLATFVGAQGELIVDTTNNRVQVHDGVTPGGWPAAKLADIVGRTSVADAAYAAKATDRTVAITTLTAPRTITLPAASAFPTGTTFTVVDESGACATIAVSIAAAGTDTINGLATWPIATAYGYVALESNGTAKWTVIDSPGTSRTAVADANYSALPTDRLVAFTALTAARTLALPPASSYPTGTQLFVIDESGACSATNSITLTRAGSDLINGSASAAVVVAYGYLAVESNGVSRWTIIDQAVGGGSASATTLSIAVRQTVMSGPASASVPTFLPATSSSLTLTAQNVTTTAPLIVTAAQGFGASGAVNYVTQFTSNPSWTAAASATNYHYVNAQTGATGTTTLQPIYQFGGTVAVTSGQFTFDYQAMIGYFGNGTTAAATPLVFVGESVAGTSTITSALGYAYNGYCDIGFVSGLPPVGGGYSNKTTNLGVLADRAHVVVENITAEQNYSVGDRLSGGFLGYSSTGTIVGALGPVINRNSVALVQPQTSYTVTNKTTGVTAPATVANWKWKIIVSVPWRTQ